MSRVTLKVLYRDCTKTLSKKTMFYQTFLRGFQLLVIGFMIYIFYECISRYNRQEDTSTVDYQWYHHHEKDIYPTISACFSGSSVIFSTEKLKRINNNFDANLYSKFLKGEHWDDKMLAVEYDQVSMVLSDHLDLIRIAQQNGSKEEWKRTTMLSMKNK